MNQREPHVAPIPTYAIKPLVHRLAENAAEKLSFGVGDPIEPLVRRLGGSIEYKTAHEQPGRLPESIVVRARNDFTIFVPTMTSPARDRFTIAHELGHLFLHYPMVIKANPGAVMAATRWVDENDSVQKRAEWEANWFAAAFLMPTESFSEALSRWPDNLHRVAAHFAVSTSAAEIRKSSL